MTRPYDLPLRRPYVWAKGTQDRRQGMLVSLRIASEEGWGEIAPPPHAPVDPAQLAADVMRATQGLDPMDPDFLETLSHRSVDARVRCGIVTAWYDAAARAAGMSMSRLLADMLAWPFPPKPTVPVNALITGSTPAEVQAATEAALADDFHCLKLKVHDADTTRIAALRDVAPQATLRLDANGCFEPEAAAAALETFAPYGIDYIEQPVVPEHKDALRALSGGDVAIALDESATDAATIDALLQDGIGDLVIIKPQRVGGPDRAVACMQATIRHDRRAVVTNSLETAVGVHATLHVAALLPHAEPCGLATSAWLAHDVAPPPPIDHAKMRPRGPGSGVAMA